MVMECKVTARKSHYPKDVPFAVPEGWVWCSFPEVAELISGQDFPPEKYNTSAKGTPYIIGASNIEDGHLRINRWTEYPSVLSQKGDVLVVCKGAGVGKVAVNDIGTVHIARQIQAVRIQDEIVSSDFMRILIDWCVPSIVTQANGLIPGLKRELLLNVLLPIPPRNEQDLIVSTLCGAFDIIKGMEVEQFNLEVNIRKSKERVLELAISGKLVPQDSSEEPAIELLKRINPDFQPSDNLHYEGVIPDGWQICRLSDLFKVTMGQSPDGTSLNRSTGIEFHQGKICFTEKYLSESDIFTTSATKCAEPNSLLCCVRAPVGVFNITSRRICIGRGLCSLSPLDADVDIEYWFYALSSLTEYYESMATGSTFKAISGDIIRNTVIAVPPRMEQKRIFDQITRLFSVLKEFSDTI
jgi:type I restriction enzyme S subunit